MLGPGRIDVVRIGARPVVLGREPGQDRDEHVVVLPGVDVSRRHCRVESGSGGHRVVDLESTNGLLVNDRPTRAADLHPFDRLQIGEFVLVYLDGEIDPQKVRRLLECEESTAILRFGDAHLDTHLEDELLSLVVSVSYLEEGEVLLDGLLEELRRLIGSCDAALLVLLEAERMRVAHGSVGSAAARAHVRRVEPLVVESVGQGAPLRGPGLLGETGETLAIPLAHRSRPDASERRHTPAEVQGALLLTSRSGIELRPKCLELLLALARQVAILFVNVRLHRQATIDALTGLANRRSLERELGSELERAKREQRSLGLLLLDIDDFKQINDEHGHAMGDDVLRGLGALLTKSLRTEDLPGRWGGEEFLVLLPGTDLAGSAEVAQKLSARVASHRALGVPPITVSIGVSAFPDHGATPALVLQHADEALYAAKRAGKRCVRYYGDPDQAAAGSDPARTQRLSVGAARSALRAPTARLWLITDLHPPIALQPGRALSLGRSEACDVVLSHPTISRLHAVVHVDSLGGINLQDASSNGIRVNEEPQQTEGKQLEPGDRIGIGPYTFEISEKPNVSGADTMIAKALNGTLRPGRLAEVLGWLSTSRSTGVMIVSGPRGGRVELLNGEPVRIVYEQPPGEAALQGEAALESLLALKAGGYSYVGQAVAGPGDPGVSESLVGELQGVVAQA